MYFVNKNLLTIKAIRVDDVALVQDEYALLSDTSKLIDAISPVQIGGLLTSPMRSALNIITAGTSNTALQYLQMYIGGSKQRILDYHRHQIEDHVISAVAKADINLQLDPAEWRQNLFARLGKDVVVEDKQLRFYF
jgi:predicted solute-binding protein